MPGQDSGILPKPYTSAPLSSGGAVKLSALDPFLPSLFFLGRTTLIAAASGDVLMCAAQYFSVISTLVRQFCFVGWPGQPLPLTKISNSATRAGLRCGDANAVWLCIMRTTITLNLDDRLFERLRKRAAASGTSISGLIERAVRLLLQPPLPHRRDHCELITFGERGQFTAQNIDKISALVEADDIEHFARG